MRPIDADALKGAFLEELFVKSGKSVQDIIDEAPTIEPCKSTEQKVADVPNDLISRESAICAIENTDCELTAWDWDELTDAINELPSADRPKGEWVEDLIARHTGEWIDREDTADIFFIYKYECSVCGGKNVFNSSYCPNCGAHMR